MLVSRTRPAIGLGLALLVVGPSVVLYGQTQKFASAAELARHQYQQGLEAFSSGDHAEAERLFTLSFQSLDNSEARIALSELYYSQGRIEESLGAAEYAVRRSQGHSDVLRRAVLLRTKALAALEQAKESGRPCDQLERSAGRSWSDDERSSLVRVAAQGGCDRWLQEHAEARPSDPNRWRVLLNVLLPRLSDSRKLEPAARTRLIQRITDVAHNYEESAGDRDVLALVSWSMLAANDLRAWGLFLDGLDDGGAAWWHYRAAQLAYVDRDFARSLAHLSEAYRLGTDDALYVGLRIGFKRVCEGMNRSEWTPQVCSESPERGETWLQLAEIAPGSVFSALPSHGGPSRGTAEAWRRLADRQPASLIPQTSPE